MKKAPLKVKCGNCGATAYRNWKAYSVGGTPTSGYPHWSGSLGVNISQIPEARRYWPDAVFNKRGDILVRSRTHKKEIMKQRGMVELE